MHHKALQCYLKHGLILGKIHKGVSFEEKTFMKPYIDLINRLQTEAGNEFEVMFYKLMKNAIFGKQMENVRARSAGRL